VRESWPPFPQLLQVLVPLALITLSLLGLTGPMLELARAKRSTQELVPALVRDAERRADVRHRHLLPTSTLRYDGTFGDAMAKRHAPLCF
jgi:hypothetical protein